MKPLYFTLITISLLLFGLTGCSPAVQPPETNIPPSAENTLPAATSTFSPADTLTPEPVVTEMVEPTPTEEPTATAEPTASPTPTIPPTPAATPWGEAYVVDAGGFSFEAPESFRVDIEGSKATLTDSDEKVTINAESAALSSGTSAESAVIQIVDNIGATADAVEVGSTRAITVGGREGLVANILGLQNGLPFSGQVVAVQGPDGNWLLISVMQTVGDEGDRWNTAAQELFAAFLRSVAYE